MADYTPTVQEVASYIRSRTRDQYGNEAGTFNEDTRPTGVEVAELIAVAEGLVVPALGRFPESLAASARSLIALCAAILVEGSYFSDSQEGSQVENLETRFDKALEGFQTAVNRNAPNDVRYGSIGVVSAVMEARQ